MILNRAENEHESLIFRALYNDDIGVFRSFISKDPLLVNEINEKKQSLLNAALSLEKFKFVRELVFSKNIDPNLGSMNNLIMSVQKNHFPLLSDLINSGANIFKVDERGENALHVLFRSFRND